MTSIFKLKKGIVIAVMAMMFLVLGLISPTISKGEKTALIFFCIIMMVIGMLIETPLVKHIKEIHEQEGIKSEPGWDGKR